ncbi:MAG TPA: flagellar hook protein FlgE [Terriglobales bacterium]|nr:flagellar hook protein FlgE [Terriglobales bacterium]
MPTFSIPLSGLTADSTALSAIANNLANQNTTGYKDVRVLFSDLFYQNLGTTGAGDPVQIGAGAQIGSMPGTFTQGSVTSTGVPTDVAIQGGGFFAVQKDGVTSYTRAGNFSVSSDNFLVTSDGQQVLGFPAVNGVIATDQGLTPLELGAGTISPPSATTSVQLTTNLNAADGVGDTFSTPVTVYDSLGASHVLTFNFTKTAPNTWNYSLSIPAADLNPTLVGGVSTPQTGVLATGALGFDGNGVLTATSAGTAGVPAFAGTGNGTISNVAAGAGAKNETITITAVDATHFSVSGSVSGALGTATVGTPFVSGEISFTLNAGSTAFVPDDAFTIATTPGMLNNITAIPITGFADGASDMTFDWNVLSGATPLLTQVAAPSSTSATQQNGSASGALVSFNIGEDGIVTGSFSNGTTAALGQIVLATFADQQGLQRVGNTDFVPTLASGPAVAGIPGTSGRGTLSGGALELSNVDIATEFANLIVAQRAFEANAKAVTTFDQITQDTINLKQ